MKTIKTLANTLVTGAVVTMAPDYGGVMPYRVDYVVGFVGGIDDGSIMVQGRQLTDGVMVRYLHYPCDRVYVEASE